MYKIGDIVRLKNGREPMIVTDVKNDKIFCSYILPYQLSKMIVDLNKSSVIDIDIARLCCGQYQRFYRPARDYVFANESISHKYTLFGVDNSRFWTEFVEHDCFLHLEDHSFSSHKNLIKWMKHTFYDTTIHIKKLNDYIATFEKKEGEEKMSKTGTLYQVIGKDVYGTYLATNSEGKYVLEMKDNSNKLEAYDVKDIEEVVPWTFEVSYGKGVNTTAHYTGAKDCVKVGDVLMRKCGSIGFVTNTNTKNKCGHAFNGSILTGVVPFNSAEVKNEG